MSSRWAIRHSLAAIGLLAGTGMAPLAHGQLLAATEDLMQLSLEDLLNVRVVSASKFSQKADDAPASVTVITREDILRFGYRTLADVLASVRGFYISSDRVYKYAGVRGFSPPGDFNNRLLVMVDGGRLNENVYDSGPIGSEFPVDVGLVARIEIIRGPGSSLYGGNALFGVVNVITRDGADLNGAEAALELSRYGGNRERVSWGKRMGNGADLLLSASREGSPGGSLRFDDIGANGGLTSGTDFDYNRSAFAKFSLDGVSVEAGGASRHKGNPTGATGAVFDNPATVLSDQSGFLDVHYRRTLDSGAAAEGRLFAGSYDYRGDWLYSLPPDYLNVDVAHGRWWGAELKWLQDFSRHHLTAGIEYQDNFRQDQANYDDGGPYYLNETGASTRWGAYAQDDYRIGERLTLSAGFRYDRTAQSGGHFSPRLAAVANLAPETVLKILYGSAFRAPNNYELYYAYPGFQAANPTLRAERIHTLEADLDHYLTRSWRVGVSAYLYRMENQIAQVTDPTSGLLQYVNLGDISGRGLELALDGQFENGGRLRGSLGLMETSDAMGQTLDNSPGQLLKLSLSWPLAQGWVGAGEVQAISSRLSGGSRIGGYAMTNLTLSREMQGGWEFSTSLYNLFDRRVQDPASPDPSVPGRVSLPADGRIWRAQLVHRF